MDERRAKMLSRLIDRLRTSKDCPIDEATKLKLIGELVEESKLNG